MSKTLKRVLSAWQSYHISLVNSLPLFQWRFQTTSSLLRPQKSRPPLLHDLLLPVLIISLRSRSLWRETQHPATIAFPKWPVHPSSHSLRSGSCLPLQWPSLFSNTHFPSLLEYSYLRIFKVILNKTSLALPTNTIMYLPSQQNALSYLSLLTSFLFSCSL